MDDFTKELAQKAGKYEYYEMIIRIYLDTYTGFLKQYEQELKQMLKDENQPEAFIRFQETLISKAKAKIEVLNEIKTI